MTKWRARNYFLYCFFCNYWRGFHPLSNPCKWRWRKFYYLL